MNRKCTFPPESIRVQWIWWTLSDRLSTPLIQHEWNFSISQSLTNKCTFPSESIRVQCILPPWPPPRNNIKSEERDRAHKAVILACGQALLFRRAKRVLQEGQSPPPLPSFLGRSRETRFARPNRRACSQATSFDVAKWRLFTHANPYALTSRSLAFVQGYLAMESKGLKRDLVSYMRMFHLKLLPIIR